MDATVLLLVPLLVLAVVSTMAFAGCKPFDEEDDPPIPGIGTGVGVVIGPAPGTPTPTPTPGPGSGPGPGPTPTPPDAYPKLILTKGGMMGSLRSYWRLAEDVAAKPAADSEPINPPFPPGAYKGNVTLNAQGILRLGSDPNDAAVELTVAGAYVEVPFNILLNPAGAFTLEAWVRPVALAAGVEGVVISSFEPQLGGGFILSLIGVSPTLMKAQVGVGEGGANFKSVQADVALDPNVRDSWHHIVATYGPEAGIKKLRIYVDGGAPKELAPGAPPLNYQPAQMLNPPGPPFRIGAGPGASPTKFFTGRIDEVALYDAALTGTEIADHFITATKK